MIARTLQSSVSVLNATDFQGLDFASSAMSMTHLSEPVGVLGANERRFSNRGLSTIAFLTINNDELMKR
jgi:hypothetical protein